MKDSVAAIIGVLLLIYATGCAERPSRGPIVHEERQVQTAPPATAPPGQNVDEACGRLTDELIAKLPEGTTLAVLPFTDADGGVRRLGVIAADGIERFLSERGVQVVDRKHLNALLTERNLQLTDVASGASLKEARTITGAKVLILGSTVEANGEMLLTAKAIDVDTGRILAITGNAVLSAKGLNRLMWYVRRPQTQRAQGDLPPLAVRYEFVTPTAGGGTRLIDGSTVHSEQKFKIRVQPNSDCYLYVLLYDSAGRANVLFPHREIEMSNDVRGGASYEIPEATKWYWFDNQPGTETFYIVASYTPLTDLDQILARMQQAGDQSRKAGLASAAQQQIDGVITRGMSAGTSSAYRPKGFSITKRGVGGVADLGWGTQGAKSTEQIDNVVVGYATVVKKLTLSHR